MHKKYTKVQTLCRVVLRFELKSDPVCSRNGSVHGSGQKNPGHPVLVLQVPPPAVLRVQRRTLQIRSEEEGFTSTLSLLILDVNALIHTSIFLRVGKKKQENNLWVLFYTSL